MQVISLLKCVLYIMDATSACDQTDPELRKQGPLYAYLPIKSGILGRPEWTIIEVLTAVYGLVNAPSSWRRTVRKMLLSLNYVESVFDPCLFFLPYNNDELPVAKNVSGGRGCAGIVLLDVEDFLQGGNERHEQLMDRLRQRFKLGKWRKVYCDRGEYLGRTVDQMPD